MCWHCVVLGEKVQSYVSQTVSAVISPRSTDTEMCCCSVVLAPNEIPPCQGPFPGRTSVRIPTEDCRRRCRRRCQGCFAQPGCVPGVCRARAPPLASRWHPGPGAGRACAGRVSGARRFGPNARRARAPRCGIQVESRAGRVPSTGVGTSQNAGAGGIMCDFRQPCRC